MQVSPFEGPHASKFPEFVRFRDSLMNVFEETVAFQLYVASLQRNNSEDIAKTTRQSQHNEMTSVIVDLQINFYADDYDKIERSMRHYG